MAYIDSYVANEFDDITKPFSGKHGVKVTLRGPDSKVDAIWQAIKAAEENGEIPAVLS